ncbi:hypothetical protein N7489_001486 [Penicillium chrysogenum]|uniref:Extracellular membrane protein CFEM domain-containing protein n=1 Tax=Penicillium chrysogenum TaxID=5076 RepID=A0ABQ8WIS3_PENCH|nr:uncharacterized protein N7489_001486 [Penicillium chrysogenum]KAJ5251076.1 hypothetical protein N7489_001486 [Penicillium chrysogenum]KAJ5262513.1 hypothetical protein N7524_007818 [Penicillium chrysogenum]KAJ5269977.1 hypothetical protein N7505_005735 [Penicillium chrysogenum]
MKAALFFLVLVNEAMVLAALAIELNNDAPPSSGCYPLADPHCGVADTFCQCRDGRSSITLPYNISNETFSYEQQVIFSSSTVQQAAVTLQWAMLAVRWGHFLFITARNKW